MDLESIMKKDLAEITPEDLDAIKKHLKEIKPDGEREKTMITDLIDTINTMQKDIKDLKDRPAPESVKAVESDPAPVKKSFFKKIDEFLNSL